MISRYWSAIRGRATIVREVAGNGDGLLFGQGFCFALMVPLLLRLPLPRLQALLEPASARAPTGTAERDRIVATLQAVLAAGRPLIGRGCLVRGLTFYYFLRRAGVDVALSFGMGHSAKMADGFDGHCWLVLDGEPYLESRDPRALYAQTYAFRGSTR